MRLVDISEYGKRHGYLKTFTAGEGNTSQLRIPANPTMKHAFSKMLFIIAANPYHTRKEILESTKLPFIDFILKQGNSFTPSSTHYWAELHRKGYIKQWRNGRRIEYTLTNYGKEALAKAASSDLDDTMKSVIRYSSRFKRRLHGTNSEL